MQEWIWLIILLLPLAAMSGWYSGRKSSDKKQSADKRFSPDYYKGLNYLLNEQPDKAIEVFVKMVVVDSDTVETHLALGGLFRKRGEVDRAIRIHQNLIARPTLDSYQRAIALLELGKDYMRAGLLDRAEGLFKDLLAQKHGKVEAYKGLIGIYQQEHDWQRAIDVSHELSATSEEDVTGTIAHFYCEMAETQMRRGNNTKTEELLQKALQSDKDCVRASILLGNVQFSNGDYKKALRNYLMVFEQDDTFAAEVMGKILDCINKGAPVNEFHEQMQKVLHAPNRHAYLPGLIKYIRDIEGTDSAKEYLEKQLQKKPSLLGLKEWLEIERSQYHESDIHDRIIQILDGIIRDEYSHQCSSCGFTSRTIYWQCPGCQSWGTIKPESTTVR